MTMIGAVFSRELRIRTTSLTWLFFDLLMPLTYLLLFGIGLDRAFAGGLTAGGEAVRYDAFFLAGVLSMASFGIAINTSYGFFVDRENGIFYEFLTYPMRRSELLVGKILFNAMSSLVQAVLTVGLGVLLLGIPLRWDLLPLTLGGVLAGTAGWFFFLTIFALRIRRNDMFNTFINIAYFLFMFASSMFYPLDGMPGWLRALSVANPLTWHTDALRFTTIGIGDPGEILVKALAFSAFLLLSFAVAVRSLHSAALK
jgi:ABC-2 type transport system permease protein